MTLSLIKHDIIVNSLITCNSKLSNKRYTFSQDRIKNPKKPEELRVVFDCVTTLPGVSLNDINYQGSDTTVELVCILFRFHKEEVAISADVEEMFMQVEVPGSDR